MDHAPEQSQQCFQSLGIFFVLLCFVWLLLTHRLSPFDKVNVVHLSVIPVHVIFCAQTGFFCHLLSDIRTSRLGFRFSFVFYLYNTSFCFLQLMHAGTNKQLSCFMSFFSYVFTPHMAAQRKTKLKIQLNV